MSEQQYQIIFEKKEHALMLQTTELFCVIGEALNADITVLMLLKEKIAVQNAWFTIELIRHYCNLLYCLCMLQKEDLNKSSIEEKAKKVLRRELKIAHAALDKIKRSNIPEIGAIMRVCKSKVPKTRESFFKNLATAI